MQVVTISNLRKQLSELVNQVGYAGEIVSIERHGRPLAVLISAEEYEHYQTLQDANDLEKISAIRAAGELEDAMPFDAASYSGSDEQQAG